MKGGGSREPQPFPSVDPFSTSLLSKPPRTPRRRRLRRGIPLFGVKIQFLPLYKLEKYCYNTQAVKKHAPVAQWIEHRIPVPRVGGSSPFRRTKKSRYPFGYLDFLFMLGGTRKAGPSEARVKNMPVACFQAVGESLRFRMHPAARTSNARPYINQVIHLQILPSHIFSAKQLCFPHQYDRIIKPIHT